MGKGGLIPIRSLSPRKDPLRMSIFAVLWAGLLPSIWADDAALLASVLFVWFGCPGRGERMG